MRWEELIRAEMSWFYTIFCQKFSKKKPYPLTWLHVSRCWFLENKVEEALVKAAPPFLEALPCLQSLCTGFLQAAWA